MQDAAPWVERWQEAVTQMQDDLGAVRDDLQRRGLNTLAHRVQCGMQPMYETLAAMKEATAPPPQRPAERRQGRGVLEVWQ